MLCGRAAAVGKRKPIILYGFGCGYRSTSHCGFSH